MTGAAASERDRIAQVGRGCGLLVFAFWTGTWSDVARLHFLTFAKARPRDSRYVLFTYDAIIPDAALNLLHDCGVEVMPFDLPRLMREAGAAPLTRRTPLTWCWPLVEKLARNPRYARWIAWFVYPGLGWYTPRANFLLGAPPVGAAKISDHVRLIISSIVPEHTLYTDIDFAFPRSLDWIFQHRSFVYRWDWCPFANTALMSVTPDSPIKRGVLLEQMARNGTARHWVLFTDAMCDTLGLEILPCDRLDPLWSQNGPDGPRYKRFFKRRESSAAELAFLKDQFDAIHWHNKWTERPDPGSPYDLWLRELTGEESQSDSHS